MWLVSTAPVCLLALILWFPLGSSQIFRFFVVTAGVIGSVTLAVCIVLHPVLVKFGRVGLHHYLLAYVIGVQPILVRCTLDFPGLEFAALRAAALLPAPVIFWWFYYRELWWMKI